MMRTDIPFRTVIFMLMLAALAPGCTTTLIKDDVRRIDTTLTHCSGGDWVDDSSIAVLPIPFVAFFVPHADLDEINGAEHLNRCGNPARLVNRKVTVSRTACIPAGLTRIITLGVWQWCPAYLSWEADVVRSTKDASGSKEPHADE